MEAQEVSLPSSVMEHLDKNECVYKLSSSVKTNHGVGKIAMTQKRLFLLTEGRPGYVEISTFRNIEVSGPWAASSGTGQPLGGRAAGVDTWTLLAVDPLRGTYLPMPQFPHP